MRLMLCKWKNAVLHTLEICVDIERCTSNHAPRFLTEETGRISDEPTVMLSMFTLANCWRVPIAVINHKFIRHHPVPNVLDTNTNTNTNTEYAAGGCSAHVSKGRCTHNREHKFFHTGPKPWNKTLRNFTKTTLNWRNWWPSRNLYWTGRTKYSGP